MEEPGWLRRRIIQGSLWLIALRWMLRGLGLIRTIVLARILAPADFGLFTMAMLTVRMLEVPTSLDLDTALVRRTEVDRRLFDTAWTLRAAQRLLVAVALLAGAPIAGWYFNDERVASAVRVAALAGGVWAVENIGIVFFRKELAFAKEIMLTTISTVVGLSVTIAGALLWRDYWALVAGFVAERLAWVTATYLLHPYRPRIRWEGARELWKFSRWIPLQNAATLLRNSIDAFLIGRFLGAAPTGIYAMGGSVAILPAAEIAAPVTTTLLPSYARLVNEPARLARGYIDALGMMAILAVASQVGIALVAPTFVPLVLGPRWTDTVPVAQWLALHVCISVLTGTVSQVLMVRGHMRRLTALTVAQLVAYAALMLWAVQFGDLVTLAAAKTAIALLLAPLSFAAVIKGSSITVTAILRVVWRPIVAAAVMAGAVGLLQASWPAVSADALATQIAVGIVSFGTALGLLWLAAGRPDGAERFALDWVTSLRR
jgi:O-antigen/teichoic acid export membrane protein